MEKFSKEYFKSLANQIMFDLSDAEVEELQAEFSDLEAQIQKLTDNYIAEVDKAVEEKTKEILTV